MSMPRNTPEPSTSPLNGLSLVGVTPSQSRFLGTRGWRSLALAAGLALGLLGCASTEELAARDDATCASFGVTSSHPQYADCRIGVAKLRNQEAALRLQRAGAIMSGVGGSMRSARGDDEPVAASPIQAQSTACFKRSEVTSTFNKICYYDCMGSPYAQTIASSSLCPLTLSH